VLLLLALAALTSGCDAGSPIPAAAQGAVASATVAATPAEGIPVTGFALEVASCDPNGSFLNFRLSHPLPDAIAARLRVEINGRSARCTNPLGDPSILSCTIPPLTMPPALVVVKMQDVVINQFPYDNSICPVGLQVQITQTAEPPTLPPASSTAPWLPPTKSSQAGLPVNRSPIVTPTNAPSWLPTLAPAPQTEPPATEPPPTQPPSTQPPATEPPPAP
jgi:hypothetical protein